MNAATLKNGKVILALEYQEAKHGSELYCIDKSCKAPIIFIPTAGNTICHFKTTGKGNSVHKESCGFAKPLSFEESLRKIQQYQKDFIDNEKKQMVIRLNLNRIDPDYEAKTVEREVPQVDPTKVKIKQDSSTTPSSISSLKSVVKLIEQNRPDTLATIQINTRGQKIPLSQLIVSPDKAHTLLWSGEANEKSPYFVYGIVQQFIRREKIYYLNFQTENQENKFSLVVFEKYFPHFTYSEEQLVGEKIIAYGFLKKNTYKNKNTSEILIKSNKYIEFVKN